MGAINYPTATGYDADAISDLIMKLQRQFCLVNASGVNAE